MRTQFRTIVLTSLLAAAGIGSAFAQTNPAPAPAPQTSPAAGPHGDMHRPGGHFDPARREAMMQKHFSVLKAKLRITPQQEGAWTTFTAAMRPPQHEGDRPKFDREELAKMTTPQRIDRMQEMQARRMAEMTQRSDAIKAFYAALTPAQQQTFDALPQPHFGHRGFGHDDHGDHGPRGGPEGHGPMGGGMPPPPPAH